MVVLTVTVLHEIKNKSALLEEVNKLINENGKIAVIEFYKRDTPMGPPTAHRISKDEAKDILANIGFIVLKDFDLGENFYCLIFIRGKSK